MREKTTAFAIPLTKSNYTVRIAPELRAKLHAAVDAAGFKSLSAFLVTASSEKSRAGQEKSDLEALEERIAASFSRLASMIELLNNSTQFNIAQVDVLAKSFYACVPEPRRTYYQRK